MIKAQKLPKGWTLGPLSDAVLVNPKRPLSGRPRVQFVDMAALPIGGAVVRKFAEREVVSGGSKFQAGDTLFARITPCTENGKLGFVEHIPDGGIAQGSTEFVVLSAKAGVSVPSFVRMLAAWDVVRSQAISFMEGTSGGQRVPSWAFELIEVPVPPTEEQAVLGKRFESIQRLIDAEQELVGATDRVNGSRLFRMKQAMITRFLLHPDSR